LNLNSNFKIQFEFEKVFNTKLVELQILKISYLGKFSSSYSKSKVIWQKQFEFENGGVLQCSANHRPATHGMGAGEPPGGAWELLARARTASVTSHAF
jgi:hypothetical protein